MINSPLLTDQYQLVMAQAYWKTGMSEREAVFHLSFRKNPFKEKYTIACGLAQIIEYLSHFCFTDDDINYLKTIKGANNEPLFLNEFLEYLRHLKITCNIDAVPEGLLVFPYEPLLRIQGPILQCQLLETPLLNLMSLPCLVATKASRVYLAAKGDPVIEFGLRRAQGPDAGIIASRAAYIGGCTGTSNVLAGKLFNIPIQGTQAHSWIMAFPDELSAFEAFANVMKNNTVLLVDTYDSIKGIKNAIQVGQQLRKEGYDLDAIRLDSGDLVTLSKKARKLLDTANFKNTKIIASGDLDEHIISELKSKKAPIDAWGVGTRLATAYDQPALNTVYKLTAIKNTQGTWDYKMKISPKKITLPGIQQVRRYFQQHNFISDTLYDIELGIEENIPSNADHHIDLLVPIFKKGKYVYRQPSIQSIRDLCITQVSHFQKKLKKTYKVNIDKRLNQLKNRLLKNLISPS